MSEQPINDNDLNPDAAPLEPQEGAPQEPLPTGEDFRPVGEPLAPAPEAPQTLPSGEAADDPLSRLRQSLVDEESNSDEPVKPAGFFRRVSDGIKGKRPQPASKPEETPAPRFGVQASIEPVYPPAASRGSLPEVPQSEEIQDDFLEKRLGTGPLSQDWRRPAAPEEPAEDNPAESFNRDASDYLSGARAASDKIQSPFSTNISRMSSMNWEDGDSENTPAESRFSSPSGPAVDAPEKTEGSYPYQVEEKKSQQSESDRKTQPVPFIAYQPGSALVQRLRSIPPVERILLAVLGIAVIGVIVMIAVFYTQSRTPAAAAVTPTKTAVRTATPAGVPVPVNLRLTGGWNFPLQRSTMVRGKWVPAGSEWLEGTEIRRVVGIPWNKQTEAVIQSMATNDKVELVMNNGDILNYKVQSVGQVPAKDTSILYDTKPSLVIVLINPDDENRWVVIAYP